MVRTLAGDFDAVSDPHSLTVGESFAHVLAKAFVAKVLEVRHVDEYEEQDIVWIPSDEPATHLYL